ncbi:unnamed protein product [Pieris macdunnoughi]|uniref:Uncharacterized protein n=1 Tax=Pieris macdunnoughi TaxID=345717 RepID=A0A821NL37_9NEOP|nr:unnamed protein product [Pieris macdunnoughi]
MGRGKEPELPTSNPVEAKKYRDEASGHNKNRNYERALASLAKQHVIHTTRPTILLNSEAIRVWENTFSRHDNHSSGVEIDDTSHIFT